MHLIIYILINLISFYNCEKSIIKKFNNISSDDLENIYYDEYDDNDSEVNKFANNVIKESNGDILNRNDNAFNLLSDSSLISKVTNEIIENLTPVEKEIKLKFFEFIKSLQLPFDCTASLIHIVLGLRSNQLWAFKFFDSMGKIPSALSEGVTSFFGDYDQCLNIKSLINNNQFNGKYCLASPLIQIQNFDIFYKEINFDFLNNKTNDLINKTLKRKMNSIKLFVANNLYIKKFTLFRAGICIPSNCKAEDIQSAVNKVFQPILKITIEIGPHCSVKSSAFNLNNHQLFSIIILTVLSFMVIISTTIEILLKRKLQQNDQIISQYENFFTSFSIIRNTQMLNIKNNSKHKYQCFNTLFLIFILWISFALYYMGPLSINLIGYKNIFNSIALDVMSEPEYFYVRTPFNFLTLYVFGGLFISLDFFSKKFEISVKSYLKFAIEKWVRFNSLCFGPILLVFILSAIGDGPMWSLSELIFGDNCRKYWWKNILFINNFVPSHLCSPASVHISNFFIFQLISPLLLITFLYSKPFGIILNTIMMFISSLTSILPKLLGKYIAPFEVSEMNSVNEIRESLMRTIFGTEQFVTPFITGLLIGYLIVEKEKISKLINNNFKIIILWIIFITFCSSAIIWGENFKDLDLKPNKTNLMLWFTVGRILWSIGLACIFIALYFGKGYVYSFLSLNIWIPITRLNIVMSLVQVILTYYRFFTVYENKVMKNSYILECFIFDLITAYIISYIFYVTIIGPVNNLIKYFKSNDILMDENCNQTHNYSAVELRSLTVLKTNDQIC